MANLLQLKDKLRDFVNYTIPQTAARVASNPRLNQTASRLNIPIIQRAAQIASNPTLNRAATGFNAGVQRVKQTDPRSYWMPFAIQHLQTGIKPVDYAANRFGSYIQNNYVAPALDIPRATGGIINPQPVNIGGYDIQNKTALRALNTGRLGFDVLGAVPDPSDILFGAYNFAKGGFVAKRNNESWKQSLDTQLKAVTGEKPVGLGDAATANPVGQTALNIAELPLLLMAGKLKGRFDSKQMLKIAPDLKEARSLLSGYEYLKPAEQIKALEVAEDTISKIGYKPNKELRNLMIQSTDEYVNFARGLVEDALYSIGHPEEKLGLSTRALKGQTGIVSGKRATPRSYLDKFNEEMLGKVSTKKGAQQPLSTQASKGVPKELEPLAKNTLRYTRKEFIDQFYKGLKDQNLTRRETAERSLKAIENAGMTLDDFYTKVTGIESKRLLSEYDKLHPTQASKGGSYPLKPEQQAKMYASAKETNDKFVANLIKNKKPISAEFVDKAPEGYVLVRNKTYGDPVEYVYNPTQASKGVEPLKKGDTYLYRAHNKLDLDRLANEGYIANTPAEAYAKILKAHPEYYKEWKEAGILDETASWGVEGQTSTGARMYFTKSKNPDYEGELTLRIKKSVADKYGESPLTEDVGLPGEYFYEGRGNIPPQFIEVKQGNKWIPIKEYYNELLSPTQASKGVDAQAGLYDTKLNLTRESTGNEVNRGGKFYVREGKPNPYKNFFGETKTERITIDDTNPLKIGSETTMSVDARQQAIEELLSKSEQKQLLDLRNKSTNSYGNFKSMNLRQKYLALEEQLLGKAASKQGYTSIHFPDEIFVPKNVAQQPLSVPPTQASKGVGDIKMDQPVKTATQLTLRPKQVPENIPTAGLISSQPQIDKPLQTAGAETINLLQGGKNTVSTVKDWAYKIQDKLYTEFVDRFHPMSKLAGMANKSDSLKRNLAKYYGSGSTADYHLQEELSPILKGTSVDDLRDAAIAMRDIELNNRGIQGSPNQENAIKTLERLKEKYGDAGMKNMRTKLEQLYAYQDKIAKEYLVDTGIMSQANYNKMRMDNNFYVPFKRVMDNVDEFLGIPVKKGAGSVGSQNVVFKIKGSDKEIVDPIESIVENTYKIVSLGVRQKVARVVADISNDLPNLVHRTNVSDARDTISLFENGKKVHYSVPQEVADAARGLSEESLVTLTKILKVPTDLFRTMTTGVNPEFLLPNVSRDVQSAMFNTGINPLKWIAGLSHYAKKDNIYKDFLREGGRTARVSLNRPFIVRTAKELAGQGFTVKSPKDIIRGLEMLSEYSEQPTRVAVFKDAYEKGIRSGLSREDALADAAYWAQEGTVNFARRGSKMTNINAIYAYLNARMQGIDRMVRTAKNNPSGAAARFGFGLLAPSLALYAWNSSNPKYYDERIVSKRDKQDNFMFMLPQPVNGVEYLKIPKAEVGKIVNPVEAFFDWSRDKGGDVWQSIGSVLKSFSPIDNWGGIIPTAINPLVENAFNKDFYTGYDLVPDYKKNYPPAYQSSSYTSPIFRMAGEKLNMSPALIQNLAESYGGGLMRVLEMGTQPFIDKKYVSAKNEQGAAINRTPVLRRFMGGEKKSEAEQIKADISKQKSIEYDVNDIKGGINRGEIPADVGIQKIQELRGNAVQTVGDPQSGGGYDLGESIMYQDATTGKWKEVQKIDMEKEIKDAEYSLQSDRLQRDEDWQGWVAATNDYINTLTDYQSKLDPVYDKAETVRIQNKIEDLVVKVNKYKSYGGFKKPKKPKKITFKVLKSPSIRVSVPKRRSFKLKKPKKIKFTTKKITIKA